MATELYTITWGRVRLWCSRVSTDNSRTVVVHELATGDDHPTSDRGRAARVVTCEILFDDMPGEQLGPLDRFLAFKSQVDSGAEELFTHPVDGPYFAKVRECRYDVDEDSNITGATVEFVASSPVTAVLKPGLAASPSAGVDLVRARADELLDDLAALETPALETDLPTRAAETVAAWTEDPDAIPTRDVIVQLSQLSSELADLVAVLEGDLALWDAYKGAILLGEAIRSAAIAATSSAAARVFFVRIVVPTSVLALVASTYGGAEAELRERQVRDLNDLRTPGGLIAAGTELVMPMPSVPLERTFG